MGFTKHSSAVRVSIRSPHKSKGRLKQAEARFADELFQSAPLTKARGDPSGWPALPERICFNPLPSQKQGETRLLLGPQPMSEVSIRSPHKSKGRPAILPVNA